MSFTPGLELSRRFYEEIEPLLGDLPHAAARIDEGSEVLGYDTPMSADHDWGPRRLQVLSHNPVKARELLQDVQGTLFVETPKEFFLRYLGFDIENELEASDWLSISEQKLLTVTSGAIFHDEIGLSDICAKFTYYPDDVWLYQMASVWTRIGQEEHLVGRAGHVGDELGAKIIAGRLVRDAMRLCFLMERRYAPYPKWLGTAFSKLNAAKELMPMLEAVLASQTWEQRDKSLAATYETLARNHNRLQITNALSEKVASFHERPFSAIEVHGSFSHAIMSKIDDPHLRDLEPIGGIDIFSDSTDLVSHLAWRVKVKRMFEPGGGALFDF